jgi:glutamate--glyoxylate aminotransferase
MMRVGLQAIQAAKQAGKSPDTWYCLKLLDATGVLTVPGGLLLLASSPAF